jgi:steroid 5-alpha reductase family enzyme
MPCGAVRGMVMDCKGCFIKRIKHASVRLMLYFIGICVSLAFYFALERLTTNLFIFFAAGIVCCVVLTSIYGVIKTLKEKAFEREEWEALSKQGGRFTPTYLKRGQDGQFSKL